MLNNILILIVLLFLGSCGQKGDLYLEENSSDKSINRSDKIEEKI